MWALRTVLGKEQQAPLTAQPEFSLFYYCTVCCFLLTLNKRGDAVGEECSETALNCNFSLKNLFKCMLSIDNRPKNNSRWLGRKTDLRESFSFCLFFLCLLVCFLRQFLCETLTHKTHSVGQTGLKLRDPRVSASASIGSKDVPHHYPTRYSFRNTNIKISISCQGVVGTRL